MRLQTLFVVLALVAGPGYSQSAPSLLAARKGFKTTLTHAVRDSAPLETPPAEILSIVKFEAPLGKMSACLSAAPGPGKHPAILWISGGFPQGGWEASAWEPQPPDNDQSAKVYRTSGVVMMYPTLRGAAGNRGSQESFFGEVNDVLAALEHLRKVEYVDPRRIYLGGHSTGGTLALLVAASTDKIRGVFSFGPAARPSEYGEDVLAYDPSDEREDLLRSPIEFLDAIRSPTWVFEGAEDGNVEAFEAMKVRTRNPNVRFEAVRGASHFDVLAPVNRLLAQKIARLEGDAELALTGAEIQVAFDEMQRATREATDLRVLANVRAAGGAIDVPRTTRHYLIGRDRAALVAAATDAAGAGFAQSELREQKDVESRSFFVLVVDKKLVLHDLDAVFGASKSIAELSSKHGVEYDGWDVE